MQNKKITIDRLANWIVFHPKGLFIAIVLILFAFASGIKNLSISNDFRVYLSENNPQLLAFELFESNYVKSDSATFTISAKKGNLFTRQGLQLIQELTEQAWLVEYAYRVSSLTNYQHSQANESEISSGYLVENATRLSAAELDEIRRVALSDQRLVHSLITPDGKLTLIMINLRLAEDEANASFKVTRQIEAISQKYRLAYPNFTIDNGGSTTFNTTLARAISQDLTTLMPLSYLIIFAGLFFFLRSFSAASAVFLLITACLICTFGFFGWVAPVLTPIAGFAPSILLSIMVADSVHLLTTYFQKMNEGKNKQQAVALSLKINFMPVLVTSVTTIIGFLSLNFSSSPPYQDLGNMVAFGVLVALLFSLFLLPSLLLLLPFKEPFPVGDGRSFKPFADFVIGNKRILIIIMSMLAINLTLFVPKNKLSDNWANYFDQSFPIVRLVKQIDGYLSGVNSLEYSFASTREKGIFDPQYLSQMDQFETWYRAQKKIINVKSLSQLMKDLNQLMHQDDTNWYKVPKTSELAAQYLLFYELGLPEGLGLDNLITIDQTESRFTVFMSDAGSDELLAMDSQAQAWLKQNAPAIKASPATGLGVVFAHIAERNIRSLLMGTLLALVGISVVLMLVLKSVKYGMISLVPNIIPAVMAYGLWGLTFGYVDISLSIVACSTLGIVVDDTVYFLHRYIRARKRGESAEKSIRITFSSVGFALLTTTFVLAGGFSILAVSHMNTSATIGILMAVTLIFALIVDFLLLPPLLLYLDKKQSKIIDSSCQKSVEESAV